jgi:prolyl 4-hydroxylase
LTLRAYEHALSNRAPANTGALFFARTPADNAAMTAARPPGPRWMNWLREQIDSAADMGAAVHELRRIGVPDAHIDAAIDALRPLGSAFANGRFEPPPLIRRAPPNLRKLDTPAADIYTLENFLSTKDCERVIALAAHHLIDSPLTVSGYDAAFRTSRTCMLSRLKSPVATGIDEKICRTMGIRAAYSEGIQAQRYEAGQEFKAHLDCFNPGTDEYRRFAGVRGNRTWTFMVYLNEDLEGGATRFTHLDLSVRPKTGMALLWNNLRADGSPNPDTRHSGEPVTRGHKVIITKWFRVLGDGPVFENSSNPKRVSRV